MKPFVLASVILFCVLIAYENKKHGKQREKQEKSFWERENEANNVRRKSLDNLEYISIPTDSLPLNLLTENPEISECLQIIQELSTQKIVNFTGISNTDLKLEYGAPNINLLTQFDQNYTLLARTLQKWAELLYENGFVEETQKVLEFAVSTRTDVSKSYYLLADIYKQKGENDKIKSLIGVAETLNSALKNSIVRTLQELNQHNG